MTDLISISDGVVEYTDSGMGAPLVLLHGGTGDIREWGASVGYFARQYRVLVYNRRGYGNSTPRLDFPPTYHDADVADLLKFLDALGLNDPVRLCGFSDGATIALMFAARFPSRVAALVLIAGHIYVEAKTQQGLLRAKRLFETGVQKKERDEAAHKMQRRRAWFDLWLDEQFRQWFNIEEALGKIRCPAFVVQGTEDEYANVSQARRIAEGIPNAGLYLVAGAKHYIHGGDQAEALYERVMTFLGDNSGGMGAE